MPAQGRPESATFQTSPLNTEVTLPIVTDVNNGPTAQRTAKNGAPPDLNPITRTEHMADSIAPSPRYVYSRQGCIRAIAGEDPAYARHDQFGRYEDPSDADFSTPAVAAALERLRAWAATVDCQIASDVVADDLFAFAVEEEAGDRFARSQEDF